MHALGSGASPGGLNRNAANPPVWQLIKLPQIQPTSFFLSSDFDDLGGTIKWFGEGGGGGLGMGVMGPRWGPQIEKLAAPDKSG